jgi:hypothetical protein
MLSRRFGLLRRRLGDLAFTACADIGTEQTDVLKPRYAEDDSNILSDAARLCCEGIAIAIAPDGLNGRCGRVGGGRSMSPTPPTAESSAALSSAPAINHN